MTKEQLARERRKQRRLAMLGTNEPRCGMCGDDRWQCIEAHHPSDHDRDDTTVLLCRNCHRVVSDDQKDHLPHNSVADPMLDSIGHFLLGLADMLRIVVGKLYEFGQALIARAAPMIEGDAK
jgi:hypothetical protein